MACGCLWLGQGFLGTVLGEPFNDLFGKAWANHGYCCVQLHTPQRHFARVRILDCVVGLLALLLFAVWWMSWFSSTISWLLPLAGEAVEQNHWSLLSLGRRVFEGDPRRTGSSEESGRGFSQQALVTLVLWVLSVVLKLSSAAFLFLPRILLFVDVVFLSWRRADAVFGGMIVLFAWFLPLFHSAQPTGFFHSDAIFLLPFPLGHVLMRLFQFCVYGIVPGAFVDFRDHQKEFDAAVRWVRAEGGRGGLLDHDRVYETGGRGVGVIGGGLSTGVPPPGALELSAGVEDTCQLPTDVRKQVWRELAGAKQRHGKQVWQELAGAKQRREEATMTSSTGSECEASSGESDDRGGEPAKTEKDDRSGKGLLALARTDDEFSSGLHSTMSFHHHWTPLELDHLEDHEFSSTNIIGLHWTVT